MQVWNVKTLNKTFYQPPFDLIFSWIFMFFFCVFEERDIKVEQNYIFSFLTKLGYGTLTELILGGQNVKFQKTDKQLKFWQNHMWVSCNLPKI